VEVLVTGIAGFIGFHYAKRLLAEGYSVVGIDNLNDYYDVQLKKDRLKELGIVEQNNIWVSLNPNLSFFKIDLVEKNLLLELFSANKFDYVIHLAAQAGVRYSLSEPQKYIDSNITGFLNILEGCRFYPVKHLIFASSSSVYGLNSKVPFTETDRTDSPISIYAATKKANELMAHAYSHLFKIPSTGLRFFTVYGPWGRPDMAMHLFTKAIINSEKLQLFNGGELSRDFTFVDDVVESVFRAMLRPKANDKVPLNIFNVGKNQPEKLGDFVKAIEKANRKQADKEFLAMQPGDVELTFADVECLFQHIGFKPKVSMEEGVIKYSEWYANYYSSDKHDLS
jgi:UDP-glucuronate 4-epimerase